MVYFGFREKLPRYDIDLSQMFPIQQDKCDQRTADGGSSDIAEVVDQSETPGGLSNRAEVVDPSETPALIADDARFIVPQEDIIIVKKMDEDFY